MTIEVNQYSKELREQILKEVKETGNMALVARSRGISYAKMTPLSRTSCLIAR